MSLLQLCSSAVHGREGTGYARSESVGAGAALFVSCLVIVSLLCCTVHRDGTDHLLFHVLYWTCIVCIIHALGNNVNACWRLFTEFLRLIGG